MNIKHEEEKQKKVNDEKNLTSLLEDVWLNIQIRLTYIGIRNFKDLFNYYHEYYKRKCNKQEDDKQSTTCNKQDSESAIEEILYEILYFDEPNYKALRIICRFHYKINLKITIIINQHNKINNYLKQLK